ncbi:MAG: hypothetical protein BWY68_00411 [bacterium ADurb.Bin400]|nr:MAG: hypothetical protein BWY68_00411 [bacterium ADurb.Bin400]
MRRGIVNEAIYWGNWLHESTGDCGNGGIISAGWSETDGRNSCQFEDTGRADRQVSGPISRNGSVAGYSAIVQEGPKSVPPGTLLYGSAKRTRPAA